MSSMARIVSLTVLTVLIVFLGITFFHVIAPFLLPLFLAGVVTVLCQPVFNYFQSRTNQQVRLSAGLTTLTVLAMFFIPLTVGTFIGSVQLYSLAQRTMDDHTLNEAFEWIQVRLDALAENIPANPRPTSTDPVDSVSADAPEDSSAEVTNGEGTSSEKATPVVAGESTGDEPQANSDSDDARSKWRLQARKRFDENVRLMLRSVAERSLGIAGRTFDILKTLLAGLIGFLMFVIALYYFLADGPAFLASAENLIPVHAEYQRELLKQFDKVVRAVVLATFMAAIGQGLATATALSIVGFNHFFIFFIVATMTALIPLMGTWVVWVPCAVMLGVQEQWGACIFLVVIGSVVIGTLDNVIRTYFLHTDAKLHPLLAFVSVLGGLQAMGLWGVFIGPIVACCLHALVQIFNTELKDLSNSRQLALAGGAEAGPSAANQHSAQSAAHSRQANQHDGSQNTISDNTPPATAPTPTKTEPTAPEQATAPPNEKHSDPDAPEAPK